jgi:hypothetical protein
LCIESRELLLVLVFTVQWNENLVRASAINVNWNDLNRWPERSVNVVWVQAGSKALALIIKGVIEDCLGSQRVRLSVLILGIEIDAWSG